MAAASSGPVYLPIAITSSGENRVPRINRQPITGRTKSLVSADWLHRISQTTFTELPGPWPVIAVRA
jgi:hypothetical protein